MGFLLFLKSGLGRAVAFGGAILAAIGFAYFKGRGDQKDKAKAKVVDKIIEVTEDVKDVEKVIRERAPDANRSRLRKFARNSD